MYKNNNLNFKLCHRPLLLDIFTEHSSRDVSSIMLTANSALKLKMLIWPIYNSMLSEIWCYRSQEYSKVLKWARMHPKYPLRSSQVGLCLRNWQKLSRKLFRWDNFWLLPMRKHARFWDIKEEGDATDRIIELRHSSVSSHKSRNQKKSVPKIYYVRSCVQVRSYHHPPTFLLKAAKTKWINHAHTRRVSSQKQRERMWVIRKARL